MKILYNGSVQDEYYTPVYAVELIERYLKPNSKILCPFDTIDSNFVKYLSLKGHYVSYSHIAAGIDFFSFTKEQVKDYDYIVSNPPFSEKTRLFEKLIELERPFAILLPIAQTMETQVRQDLFNKFDVQLLHPNKRIHFFSPIEGTVKKATTFSSGYFCGGGVLPRDLVFANIDKTLMGENEYPQCPFTWDKENEQWIM
jgi:hypothetical protein